VNEELEELHQEWADEEQILDDIYEALAPRTQPHELKEINWYGITEKRPRAFLYLEIDGRCYKIRAERHYHKG